MDRPQTPSLVARLGTALLLTAAALTAMPAAAGAWSTATPDSAPKATAAKSAKTTKTAKTPTRTTTPRRTSLTTTDERKPLAMGISLIEGNTARLGDDLDALDAWAARSGAMPASYSIWSDWGGDSAEFPPQWLLRGLRDRGVRPVIFWQPVGKDWRTAPGRYAYERVVAGDWDAYLTRWATDAKAWGGRVIVRWAHEMNAPWFPWAIGKVGNTTKNYKAAWRHVVTLVRGIAPNVRFMWAPNAPCARCVAYADLYPGDDTTDLVGFDVYAWDAKERQPMADLYAPSMEALRSLTSLPVVVGETGAAGPSDGRDVWLRDGAEALLDTYPEIEGLLYFDIDMRFDGHPDWRLSEEDGTLEAWSDLAMDPRFTGILDPEPADVLAMGESALP